MDSWLVSVGGAYRLDDVWTLRGGLGWDQTPPGAHRAQ